MTTTTYTRTSPWKSPLFTGPGGALSAVLGQLWAWHEEARSRYQLAGLDDRALKDIGVRRADAGGTSYIANWHA